VREGLARGRRDDPGLVSGPDHLFVYGTLLPGEVRWRLLVPCVTGPGVLDTVQGRLYDTRWGYPAAVFAGTARIRGRVYRLRDDGREASLAHLDAVEDVDRGEYRRVVVATGSGRAAWSYEYADRVGPHFRLLPGGNWQTRR
jgi:gamma-glutamylcyclotransferase (GGCT)/AIG2-like uncharacterized protein YtfP